MDPTQNENEMQVRTQRVADNANKKLAELRKEIKESKKE